MFKFANNATSQLAAAIDDTDTSLDVLTGEGALFPSLSGSDTFRCTLVSATDIEIVSVTARATDTFTVVRGQEGTTAVAFPIGATVELRLTKSVMESFATADALAKQAEVLMIAVGDESTVITAGTAKVTFRMPFAFTLTAVRANLKTASASGGPVTVDINEGGSTILSTKLTIDDTEKTSTTASTPAVISDASLADDAEMTIDIDDEGSGAVGLKVTLIGTRT